LNSLLVEPVGDLARAIERLSRTVSSISGNWSDLMSISTGVVTTKVKALPRNQQSPDEREFLWRKMQA